MKPNTMKNQLIFSMVVAATLLIACQPPVTFNKPQPADVNSISNFPKRLQGKYLSTADGSVLQISYNSMIRIYDYDAKVHISQLDSNLQLIGDTLFDLRINKGSLAMIEGDSVLQHFHETDTLFRIDELNVLKKYKGYYFINIFILPETWQVQELEFSRGKLTLACINDKEDINQLKELTDSPQDTVPYVFSPTKMQFRSFVRNEGFREKEIFEKVRE